MTLGCELKVLVHPTTPVVILVWGWKRAGLFGLRAK